MRRYASMTLVCCLLAALSACSYSRQVVPFDSGHQPAAQIPDQVVPAVHQVAYQPADDEPAPLPAEPLATPDQAPRELAPAALSLEGLEQLALANNPTLAQAQAAVMSRVGVQLQAGLYPNPRLGYAHTEIGNEGHAGQQGGYVVQEVVRGGKLALEQHAAGHAVQAAEFQQLAQQYRVLTSLRMAFYDVLAAQQTIALAGELVRISQQGVETADALIKGGQASRVDLLQARVELNNARIALEKARNRERAAWSRLAALAGVPDLPPTELLGSLEADSAALEGDEVFRQILASSPELAAAQQEVLRAQAALERARAEPIPNVNVQTGVQYDYGTEDTYANLLIELPLPLRNRNQGNVLKALAELTAACHELQRVELELGERFAKVWERYGNATTEVERYKTSLVPDAQESLELLSEVYQAEGKIDFLRLLLAQRTNFTTQIDYLGALREWWAAKLEMEGLLLTGGLQRPGSRNNEE